MRQIFIANTLVVGAPVDKGAIAMNYKGDYFNPSSNLTAPPSKDDLIHFLNSLGNGSVKSFTVNPFNFDFSHRDSGNDTQDVFSFVFPTGSLNTFSNYVTGGISIMVRDNDKNIWKHVKTIPVVVSTSLWTDVRAAVNAEIAKLGSIFGAKTTNGQTDSYPALAYDYQVSFTGDLTAVVSKKTFGERFAIHGLEAVQLERELSPNMGFSNTLDKAEYFADSNFIADVNQLYDITTITTSTDAQRALVLGSGGFIKQLHIFTKSDAGGKAIKASLINFLTKLKSDPTGQSIA